MERFVKSQGLYVVEKFVGHGIGQDMHEEPQVPNFVSQALRKHDIKLEPGIVLAIEPMVALGTKDVRTLDDGWTVETKDRRPSAHFEHTVAMTPEGPAGADLPGRLRPRTRRDRRRTAIGRTRGLRAAQRSASLEFARDGPVHPCILAAC